MAFVAKAAGLLQDNRSKLNNNGLDLHLLSELNYTAIGALIPGWDW